jgi:hypothetical protein
VCSSPLTKCINKVCAGGTIVSDLTVTLRTNDDDKDDDTGLRIAIDGLATWEQSDQIKYDEWSTHIWPLNPPAVRLDDLAGRYFSICMLPNGNDTWKFNLLLQGNRTDGLKYELRKDNVFLSTDVPCISWDATPDPTPKGEICADGKCTGGKCLTVTKGGAVGSAIALNDCVGSPDQQWVLAPEVSAPLPDGSRTGQLRHPDPMTHIASQCLGLPGGNTTSGMFIELQNCNGSPGQQWKWFGDPSSDQSKPTKVTGSVGRCLDPRGQGEVVGGTLPALATKIDTSLHFLEYEDCDGSQSQAWTLPACGTANQACCESGMPCQGTLSCSNGTCSSAQVANVNDFWLRLETTNEDKDHDTQAKVDGVWLWPGDGDTPYDDWSTHQAQLIPGLVLLTTLMNSAVSLHSKPHGDDSWKLNFIVNGVREDGTHYEFRKDNVWLTNEGDDATNIQWNVGPPGLDLVWKDTDANGLPLNPTWRGAPGSKSCGEGSEAACWDAFKVCPYHPTPLESNNVCIPGTDICTGATPDDYGRCSSQAPTYDRSSYCGWHANWFPVAFDGTADSADFSTWPKDGDWHVDFSPHDPESNVGRVQLLAEFDSDETTENFTGGFWNNEVDLSRAVNHNDARIIGLMGLDTEHLPPGGHAELHPTYAFQMRVNSGGPSIDAWALFVRNWGNQGACGASQHYLDLTQFTLRFPSPRGADGATSVKHAANPSLDAGSESGSSWSNFTVSGLSPLQHDAAGHPYVEMTFTIGPPEDHTFIDGEIFLEWMCGNVACPQPPPNSSQPTAQAPASGDEDGDAFPGANLLSKDQLSQIQKQLPPRRTALKATPRTVAVVPYTTPTPQVFRVGQGSLSDRTVPDLARQQRMVETQKSICTMLANDPKKPAICKSLP